MVNCEILGIKVKYTCPKTNKEVVSVINDDGDVWMSADYFNERINGSGLMLTINNCIECNQEHDLIYDQFKEPCEDMKRFYK